MVDHVHILGAKIIFPKLLLAVFGLFLFIWILRFQIGAFSGIDQIPFENWVIMIWLVGAGVWNLFEGIATLPAAKNGGAKSAGYFMIGVGIVALILGMVAFFAGADVIFSTPELAWVTGIVLFVAVIQWFGHVIQETRHQKNFVRSLN